MPGLWTGNHVLRGSNTAAHWRCFALCWSCGREVPAKAASRDEVERPMHWACSDCDVRWYAYADRVELPVAMAS